MKKVNLFIIGAPKCGTTFLWDYFSEINDIFCPPVKELNFFSFDSLENSNIYYNDYRIKNENDYFANFDFKTDHRYYVDGSVSYLLHSESIIKILKYNPNAKFIILLRNPINRCLSHYNMDRWMGLVDKDISFYIDDPKTPHYKEYIENSLYHRNISRVTKILKEKKDQLLIINFEQKEKIKENLESFLELTLDEINFNKRVNSNLFEKNSLGRFFVKNRILASKIKNILPNKYLQIIKSFGDTKKIKEKANIDDYTKQKILNIIVNDIKLLNLDYGIDINKTIND